MQAEIKFRTFVAYTLPEKVKKLCDETQAQLANDKNIFKLVSPKNTHITILFLGNKTANELNQIKDSLVGIGAKIKEVSFTITKVSAFGKPPIIFFEAADKKNKGKLLAEEISSKIQAKIDNPWLAHITLARTKPRHKFRISYLEDIKFKPLTFSPSGVAIFTSILTPQGPVYTVFHRC